MWKKIGHQLVGGLREVGFIRNTDFLMVLGSQGRTIYNCLTNNKIARDRQDYYTENWDFNTGIIKGFDEFKDENVICGGFEFPDTIIKETKDKWGIEIIKEKRLDYKKDIKDVEVMYLVNIESSSKIEVNVFYYSITRAYGFSKSGMSFIIAESDGITIWIRDE